MKNYQFLILWIRIFWKKLENLDIKFEPISLVFIGEKKDNQELFPVILTQQGKKDIAEKITRISSMQDKKIPEEFIKLLEGLDDRN